MDEHLRQRLLVQLGERAGEYKALLSVRHRDLEAKLAGELLAHLEHVVEVLLVRLASDVE